MEVNINVFFMRINCNYSTARGPSAHKRGQVTASFIKYA